MPVTHTTTHLPCAGVTVTHAVTYENGVLGFYVKDPTHFADRNVMLIDGTVDEVAEFAETILRAVESYVAQHGPHHDEWDAA